MCEVRIFYIGFVMFLVTRHIVVDCTYAFVSCRLIIFTTTLICGDLEIPMFLYYRYVVLALYANSRASSPKRWAWVRVRISFVTCFVCESEVAEYFSILLVYITFALSVVVDGAFCSV